MCMQGFISYLILRSDYMASSRSAFLYFEKLNDRQFKIHTHMCTGDLLALRFFLLPADHCLSDRALKYLNFVLNLRCLVNNTQCGLSTFFKNQVLVLFWPVHPC